MKKFRFKLEKLLDIRKAEEERAKNRMASVLALQNAERLKQEQAADSLAKQKQIYSERMRGGTVTGRDIILNSRFTDSSLRSISSAQVKIDEMQPRVNTVRNELAEASRGRKVVEKLKERREAEFHYEMNRSEFKDNDDINQNLSARRRMLEEAGD